MAIDSEKLKQHYHLTYKPFSFFEDEYTQGLTLYLVGGAVRDRLLNYPIIEKDWVVVGANPEHMIERGFKPVGKDFPVFLHPLTGEEYALARTERKEGHGHKGFIYQADASITLEQDLLRRDLTLNAIAQNARGELIDPCQGLKAIKQHQLKHIGDAFSEDPLRLFRVARFQARYAFLGFYISRSTIAAMRDISRSGELNYLSAERVWQETEKALAERNPEQYFETLQRCGALSHWFTEIDNTDFKNTLKALSIIKKYLPQRVLRWATLIMQLNAQPAGWLQERLRIPKAYQQAAQRLRLGVDLTKSGLNAHRLLQWANEADFWRQNEAMPAIVAILQILYPHLEGPLLINAIKKAQQLNVSEIVRTSQNDAEIGQRIQSAKLASIEESLRDVQ